MHLLTLLLLVISVFFLNRRMNIRLAGVRGMFMQGESRHRQLFEENQIKEKDNKRLANAVENLIDFYEITKELTKYRSLEEVSSVFRESLKRNIPMEDYRFVKTGVDTSQFSNYEFFPMQINKQLIGHLAIKGLKAEDKDKFYILFNQFLLVLKRVQLYSKIEELSITDSLTGLFLRHYFQKRLIEEISRSEKLGLSFVFLMLDLDRFKSYNDRYGHLVGDVLLSEVARIIKENVREIDIVARYGGEEFSIILPDIDREGAGYVSMRLCRAIEKASIRAYDEELQITVSTGASIFPGDSKEAKDLIDKADRALYRAKQSGRNQVCFWGEK